MQIGDSVFCAVTSHGAQSVKAVLDAPTLHSPQTTIKGDVNIDGKVDIIDVIAVNKHILGIKVLSDISLKNADMNGNGKTEADDSLAILKTVLNDAAE